MVNLFLLSKARNQAQKEEQSSCNSNNCVVYYPPNDCKLHVLQFQVGYPLIHSCINIDSERRVLNDLEIICWSSSHLKYSFLLAAPSLIVWGFGIPLFAWLVLYKHRHEFEKLEVRVKYGFLFNGYKKRLYFWESINMYRKITIIFISVFLKSTGVITQALVVFLVLILFVIINLKLMPFTFRTLNNMEILSLITSMLTIY